MAMHSLLVEFSYRFASTDVVVFLTTLFGSVAMYMFSLYKGFEGTTPALKRLMPNKTQVYYDRLDFLFVVVTGSIIGTIFFHPKDALQGLSAGFGWVGALSVLTNPKISDKKTS
jgi:uncharacterized membrane protein YbjE (DUF340 family)